MPAGVSKLCLLVTATQGPRRWWLLPVVFAVMIFVIDGVVPPHRWVWASAWAAVVLVVTLMVAWYTQARDRS